GLRLVSKAILEVYIDGKIGGLGDLAAVLDCLAPRNVAERPTQHVGKAETRGRQGFEPQSGEQSRRADVPRIGNDESAGAFMEGAEFGSFFGLAQHVASP